jgi:nicotinate-nucleotide adenylyltransferase
LAVEHISRFGAAANAAQRTVANLGLGRRGRQTICRAIVMPLDAPAAPWMLAVMRIGVFGGTFDPVHRGHLLLAECCQRQLSLARILFVPAAHQPHKPTAPRAGDADRVAMLELAIRGRPEFEVCPLEIERGGRSFMVDTLRELKSRAPEAELFLLVGADALADLPNWREAAEVCTLATPAAVRRAGWAEPDFAALVPVVGAERAAEIRDARVEMPETEISSTEVQRLIAEGGDWRVMVAPEVAEYIAERGLYGVRGGETR